MPAFIHTYQEKGCFRLVWMLSPKGTQKAIYAPAWIVTFALCDGPDITSWKLVIHYKSPGWRPGEPPSRISHMVIYIITRTPGRIVWNLCNTNGDPNKHSVRNTFLSQVAQWQPRMKARLPIKIPGCPKFKLFYIMINFVRMQCAFIHFWHRVVSPYLKWWALPWELLNKQFPMEERGILTTKFR